MKLQTRDHMTSINHGHLSFEVDIYYTCFISTPSDRATRSEDRYSVREASNIISIARHTLSIDVHHALTPDSVEIIHGHLATALHTENALLTTLPVPCRRASGVVVVKERVQPSAIHIYVASSVDNTKTPAVASVREVAWYSKVEARACSIVAKGREHWIIPAGHCADRQWCWRVWLVVSCLRLYLTHEDILDVRQLILVQCVVFDRRAVQPDCTSRRVDV